MGKVEGVHGRITNRLLVFGCDCWYDFLVEFVSGKLGLSDGLSQDLGKVSPAEAAGMSDIVEVHGHE